jgi:hypothetical protein
MLLVMICYACKKELSIDRHVSRKDTCPSCDADLHCCLNCSYFDSHISKQCREPVAELVNGKSKSNYCDFFVFGDSRPTDNAEDTAAKKARKALNSLFKK